MAWLAEGPSQRAPLFKIPPSGGLAHPRYRRSGASGPLTRAPSPDAEGFSGSTHPRRVGTSSVQGVVRGPRGRAWRALEREIDACRRCPLGALRSHPVVYRGAARPSILFVGEAPGREEDRTGRPFVGRAGHRLDDAIEDLGLPRTAWGILNVVKCHPPGNRLPTASIPACRPFLERQLEILRPTLLVPLGAHALHAVDPSAPAILRAAGHPRRAGRYAVFPLVHPAAGFRSRAFARRWSGDVGRLKRWLRPRLETL